MLGSMNIKLVTDGVNSTMMRVPDWVTSMVDFRHLLGHDQSQTLIAFSVNNRLGLTILDTDTHHTMMFVRLH